LEGNNRVVYRTATRTATCRSTDTIAIDDPEVAAAQALTAAADTQGIVGTD
jgi:hypothetical protein